MFRIIALAFVIAKSPSYAHDHEEYPEDEWQYIFPDECLPAILAMHDWQIGIDGVPNWHMNSMEEITENCEDVCGYDCDNLVQSVWDPSQPNHEDYSNQEHCERTSFHG